MGQSNTAFVAQTSAQDVPRIELWTGKSRDVTRRAANLVRRVRARLLDRQCVSLRPSVALRGHVLLSYILEPFLVPAERVSNAHTNHWESRAIADVFLAEGFAVDVIRFTNHRFRPRKPYAFMIDARWNLQRLDRELSADCVRIAHLDTAHIAYHNAAEAMRLLALYERRGVSLQPRRMEIPNQALEVATCATMLGNDFTHGTYRPVKKPIYRLPVPPVPLHPPVMARDFATARRHFVWFNSGGMVHKGLDLTLEAFAAMPDLTLTICGPVHAEEDFVRAYRRELFETPNIRTLGWVDVGSAEFRRVLDGAVAVISPSCSEGQSGSAATCLHAGLIPILSYQCGIDVDPAFGIVLQQCTIDEIKEAARRIADLPDARLADMSQAVLAFARAHHTRERFSVCYRDAVQRMVATYGK